ncbi:hypothetical protein Tco_1198511 [Tanacetum coccineum]
MMHSIFPCYDFISAMSAYSFTMHHLASRLPSTLYASCMVSYKDDLYKHLLVQVMVAPTIPISTDSTQGSFGDMIEIGVDVIHPKPVAIVAFPAATIVRDTSSTQGGDTWYSRAIARDAHTKVRGDRGGAAESKRKSK